MEVLTAVVNERLERYLAKEASTQTLPISDIDRVSFDEDEWEIVYESPRDEEERKISVAPPPARLRVIPELEGSQNPNYRLRSVRSQTVQVSAEDLKMGSSVLNPRVAAVNAAVQGLTEHVRDESHLHIDFATFDKYILQSSEPFPDDTLETARRILQDKEFLRLYSRRVEADAEVAGPDSSASGIIDVTVALIQFILDHANSSMGTPYMPSQPKLVFSTQLLQGQGDGGIVSSPPGNGHGDLPPIDCVPVFLADGSTSSERHCSDALFLCTFTRQYQPKAREIRRKSKRKRSTPNPNPDPEPEADDTGTSAHEEETDHISKRTRRSVATAVVPSRPTTRSVGKLKKNQVVATSSRNDEGSANKKKTPQTRRGARGNRRLTAPSAVSASSRKPARNVENDEHRADTSEPPGGAGPSEQSYQAPSSIPSSSQPSVPIIRAGLRPSPALMRLVADVFTAPGCRRHILALSFDQLHVHLWYFDHAGSVYSEMIPILDIRFIATVLRIGISDRRQAGFEPRIRPPAYGVAGPGVDISGYRMVVQGREFVLDTVIQAEVCTLGKTVYLAHRACRDQPGDTTNAAGMDDAVFVELQWPLADSPRADELVHLAVENNNRDASGFLLYASAVITRLSDGVRGSIFPGGADRLYLDRELRVQVFGPLPTSSAEDFNDLSDLRELYASIAKCSYIYFSALPFVRF